jgi:hypothetical protein
MRSLPGDNPDIVRLNYKRNTVDVQDAVNALRAFKGKIKAVVMVASYRAAAKFIERTRDLYPSMIWPEVTKRFSDTHKQTKVEHRSDRRRATRGFPSDCRLGRVGGDDGKQRLPAAPFSADSLASLPISFVICPLMLQKSAFR